MIPKAIAEHVCAQDVNNLWRRSVSECAEYVLDQFVESAVPGNASACGQTMKQNGERLEKFPKTKSGVEVKTKQRTGLSLRLAPVRSFE